MHSILKQFRRAYSDNGANDKNFDIQEGKLKASLENLKNATNEVIRASQRLSEVFQTADVSKLH